MRSDFSSNNNIIEREGEGESIHPTGQRGEILYFENV